VVLDDGELNGTYTAISDGQWAKTNEVYRDETSVTSTWTISSTCSTFMDCAGRVSSDQGWSADIRMQGGMWKVVHQVADWEKCADGMTAPGEQTFTFFKVDAATHVGWDKTIGPSGACGINRWLTVKMPFKLVKRT
jgi:hypothetical protein